MSSTKVLVTLSCLLLGVHGSHKASSSSSTKHASSSSTSSSVPFQTCVPFYGLNQLARFDNLPSVGVAAVIPVGIYDDLMFNGFTLNTVLLNGLETGVVPQSAPNTAAFGPLTAVTILQGTPALTTVYQDSTIAFFNFFSFFFGCTIDDGNGLASVPQSCIVTVTGTDTNGNTVASQNFTFIANGLQDQMVQAKLSSKFVGLQNAAFEVEPTGTALPTNATLAVLTDTYSYTVFSTAKIQ